MVRHKVCFSDWIGKEKHGAVGEMCIFNNLQSYLFGFKTSNMRNYN